MPRSPLAVVGGIGLVCVLILLLSLPILEMRGEKAEDLSEEEEEEAEILKHIKLEEFRLRLEHSKQECGCSS